MDSGSQVIRKKPKIGPSAFKKTILSCKPAASDAICPDYSQ